MLNDVKFFETPCILYGKMQLTRIVFIKLTICTHIYSKIENTSLILWTVVTAVHIYMYI